MSKEQNLRPIGTSSEETGERRGKKSPPGGGERRGRKSTNHHRLSTRKHRKTSPGGVERFLAYPWGLAKRQRKKKGLFIRETKGKGCVALKKKRRRSGTEVPVFRCEAKTYSFDSKIKGEDLPY